MPDPSSYAQGSAPVTPGPFKQATGARGWILCLAASVIGWLLVQLFNLLNQSSSQTSNSWNAGTRLAVVALSSLNSILLITAIVLFINHMHRVYVAHRRRAGHFTLEERREIARRDDLYKSWDHARALAISLLSDDPGGRFRPWDVVLDPGEAAVVDCPAGYARFYGTTVSYTQSSGMFFGSPAFVLAGMGATAISNSARRRAAERLAADQWREHQQVRCLVTEQRILLQRADYQWLSFYFSAIVSMHPFPAEGLFFAEFEDTSPLRLEGAAAVIASVVTVWYRFGATGLRDHPGLQCLRLPQQVLTATEAVEGAPPPEVTKP